ncbi:hypothetical protein SAMN05660462_01931 [Proteiniborus ethanoligenes]|uniref:Lipoprotein n=1 Tax=Proteiniborus ethanoligenes TaxID=415015 RepID=A0A1H3QI52_9FIRM|nr:hypothetical protein [Proteiniborus ethanoligenes]SDZ12379.1 hypothetical protein SAMN05660462_01931 [Proteiniborus ethanoligenes]
MKKSKYLFILLNTSLVLLLSACGGGKNGPSISNDNSNTESEIGSKRQLWPTEDLPGLPELKGNIESFFKEENSSYLTIKVEGTEIVEDYIELLREKNIEFWDEPVMYDGNMQFLSSISGNTLNFAYKESEKLVFIEYMLN